MNLPPRPAGLDRVLMWDLSPLRPWEWRDVDAHEWTEAQAIRSAFDEGVRTAQDDIRKKREVNQRLKAQDDAWLASVKAGSR